MKRNRNFSNRDTDPEGKSNEEILAEKVRIFNEGLNKSYYGSHHEASPDNIIAFLKEQLEYGYLSDEAEIAAYHLLDVFEYLIGETDHRPRSLAVYAPTQIIMSEREEYDREGDLDQLYNDSICWEEAIKKGWIDQLQIQYAVLNGGYYAPEEDYTNHPIDKDSHTGLWVAVTQPDPNIDVIKFLFDKGADVNQWSDQGYPSHWTAFDFDMLKDAIESIEDKKKAVDVAELLIKHGAKIDSWSYDELLEIAEEKDNPALVKLIKEHKPKERNFSHRPLRRQFSNRRRRFYR